MLKPLVMKPGPKPIDSRAVRAWRKYRPQSPIPLATALGVTPPAVSKWPYVPKNRLSAVAEFLGVKASELRPDISWHNL